MKESKRKFKRYDIPLHVKFRPTYGATDYASGITKNVSGDGFGLEARDFRFILYENLELMVHLPESETPVYLFGDILWKQQDGARCRAGIKFRMKDSRMKKEATEKIFSSSKIPLASMYRDDLEYSTPGKTSDFPLSFPKAPDMLYPILQNKIGFTKQYYNDGSRCRVTFRLLKEWAGNSRNAVIVGDFNEWDSSKSPMTQLANGDFVITLELDSKREYRFRYLIDGDRWENDWYADRYTKHDSGPKASVVIL